MPFQILCLFKFKPVPLHYGPGAGAGGGGGGGGGTKGGEGDVPVPPPLGSGMLPMTMMRTNAVREAAIVNLRNLSSCQPLMAPIAKRALYLLINVNLDRRRRRVERVHAAAVLHNIHKEPANRTRFYKAELRYKSLGAYRKGRSQDPPRAPKTNPLPRSASSGINGEFSFLSGAGQSSFSSMFWGGASGYGSDGDGYASGGGGSDGEGGGGGDDGGGGEGSWGDVPDVIDPGSQSLKLVKRPHEQMAGHMLHWMNQQFPPDQPRRMEGAGVVHSFLVFLFSPHSHVSRRRRLHWYRHCFIHSTRTTNV